MMTIPYYSGTYIKDGFHKKHEAGSDIINKDLFLSIVRCARQVLKNDTLGNINEHQNNTTLFRVRINENSVYSVHSDTKISALREMYKIYVDNNNCQFTTKNGPNNGQVLSNKETHIEGLYIYLDN